MFPLKVPPNIPLQLKGRSPRAPWGHSARDDSNELPTFPLLREAGESTSVPRRLAHPTSARGVRGGPKGMPSARVVPEDPPPQPPAGLGNHVSPLAESIPEGGRSPGPSPKGRLPRISPQPATKPGDLTEGVAKRNGVTSTAGKNLLKVQPSRPANAKVEAGRL